MRIWLFSFLLSLSSLPSLLRSEIQEVAVRWRNQNCSEACHQLIEKNLQKVPGALDVVLNAKDGQATMRWKPRAKFRYSDINLAIRTVGVALVDIHVKVRGTVSHVGKKVTLDSLGDETSFILFSPLEVKPNRTATPNNIDSYSLDPQTLAALLQSESGFYLTTVSGTLLMPERSPPNYLIIEQLEGPPEKTDDTKKESGKNVNELRNGPRTTLEQNRSESTTPMTPATTNATPIHTKPLAR